MSQTMKRLPLAAAVLLVSTAALAEPPQVVLHKPPVMAVMAPSAQVTQLSVQLSQQQARIDQLEAKLDALAKAKSSPVAPGVARHPVHSFRPVPPPVVPSRKYIGLASRAAGMRVLSTKISSDATTESKPQQIAAIHNAMKIQLMPSASSHGNGSHTDSATLEMQVQKLTHTVNQLVRILVIDEQTINQLSGSQFAMGLRVVNDEINTSNLADNVSEFEGNTTTALQNASSDVAGLVYGVSVTYDDMCSNYDTIGSVTKNLFTPYPLTMQGPDVATNIACQ